MMKDLNLLPVEILNGRQAKQRTRMMVLFLILFLMVCLLVGQSIFMEKMNYERKKASYQSQIDSLKDIVSLDNTLSEQKQRINRYQEVLNAAGNSPVVYKTVLDKLEANTPEEVFITEMSITKDNLSAKCAASSKTDVSDFIRRLKDSGIFENVFVSDMVGTSDAKDKSNGNVNFSLSCTINIQKGSTK